MQFLTLDQIRSEAFQSEYRYSVANTLAAFLITSAVWLASVYFLYRAWVEDTWPGIGLAAWFILWAGLFLLYLRMVLRARLLPTNWLVRTQTSGILVKFRSYLNHEFDPADPVVIHIGYSDIESARQHRVRQNIPGGRRGDDEVRLNRYAEFKLRDPSSLRELETRLADERKRSAPMRGRFITGSSKSPHYPVTVSADGFVRIEWNVFPRLAKFMAEISGQIKVNDSVGSGQDFRALQNASPKDQEEALLSLVAAGDRIGAIKVIKLLYGYDTTRAMKFLEELSRK